VTDPLATELARALVDAQQRYRTRRGFGAYVTPVVPAGLIEEFAATLVPAIRKAAADAQREEER
jgi:hypothetical protein